MFNLDDDTRIYQLLSDITSYMDYMREDLGLLVSVHQIDRLAHAFMESLVPYNIHAAPYCTYLKSYHGVGQRCIGQQHKLCKALEAGPFYGTCWAGVGEFVFPVFNLDNDYVGFLSISGYAGDEQKTRAQTQKISAQYGIPLDEMREMQKSLKEERPGFAWLKVLVQPLVHMFSLLQMFLEELDAYAIQGDTSTNALFSQVRRHLRNNYSAHIDLGDLAERYGCSESRLSHLFHEQAHCGYRRYVNAMRMNIAKVYLASTNMSIQEISELLGYANANYFSTVFRRECGVPARQYRENGRAGNAEAGKGKEEG